MVYARTDSNRKVTLNQEFLHDLKTLLWDSTRRRSPSTRSRGSVMRFLRTPLSGSFQRAKTQGKPTPTLPLELERLQEISMKYLRSIVQTARGDRLTFESLQC